MLEIAIDLPRVTAAQAYYREQGTVHAAGLAKDVMSMCMALKHNIKRFGERQRAAADAGDPLLEDGRQQTITDQVLDPRGPGAWPRRAAAVLHGLCLPQDPLLPETPCCQGGPNLRDCDGETYLAMLNDGPTDARTYGAVTSLALYIAPLKKMVVLWIGAVADWNAAVAQLKAETVDWTDWSAVDPAYAAWLEQACTAAKA